MTEFMTDSPRTTQHLHQVDHPDHHKQRHRDDKQYGADRMEGMQQATGFLNSQSESGKAEYNCKKGNMEVTKPGRVLSARFRC
jgi:hypothetical protein